MLNLTGKIRDADGHIMERDADLFEYLEAPFAGNEMMLAFPFFPTIDGFHRGAIHGRLGHHEAKYRITPETWLNFLDAVGVEDTVLYPTSGLTFGSIQDPSWAVALARAYNNWFNDRFYRVNKRLRGMALVPTQDVKEAVKEARRAVNELGAVGIVLSANSADYGTRQALGEQLYWPIYAEAEKLGVPISVHSGPSLGLGINSFTRFAETQALEHPLAHFVQITSMVMGGVFERFPNLRVGYFEAGAGWVPYMMDRLDRSYSVWAGKSNKEFSDWLKKKPSDYFRSGNIYFTCEGGEDSVTYTIKRIGHQTLMFASDFPHETNVERGKHEIAELLERTDITDAAKKAILRDNAIAYYTRSAK